MPNPTVFSVIFALDRLSHTLVATPGILKESLELTVKHWLCNIKHTLHWLSHWNYFTVHCSVSILQMTITLPKKQYADKPTSVLLSSWEFNVMTSAIAFTKQNYLTKYISSEASTLKLSNSEFIEFGLCSFVLGSLRVWNLTKLLCIKTRNVSKII